MIKIVDIKWGGLCVDKDGEIGSVLVIKAIHIPPVTIKSIDITIGFEND